MSLSKKNLDADKQVLAGDTRNSSGNPDPTDPVDHLFDGAPVNDNTGRQGDPEHLPSPAGDVATDPDGIARNNRDAVRANLGDPSHAPADVAAEKQAAQAEIANAPTPGSAKALTEAPEKK